MRSIKTLSAALVAVSAVMPAHAENTFSIYGGLQSLPHSIVWGEDQNAADFNFVAGWEGRSFAMPPYWGARYTHWLNDDWAWSLDFTHSKAYADAGTLTDSGFSVLEFTDGINVLTVNAIRRFQGQSRLTPYVGFGAGISIPHVEITPTTGIETFEYQFGGYALQLQLGVDYALNDKWSLFTEYKMNFVMIDVDLVDGGWLRTDLFVNAFNLGVSRRF
ncbi:MAG: porin family protein [Rhodobacteraceae bacterium]|nr:porin family protein [Paracoccaceae bacterium]